MAQNLYSPGVRMGNWNEDVYLEEERLRDFIEKRDKGELLIQRNRRLKKHLLSPVQLSISEDGFVHYGDKVILMNPNHAQMEEAGTFLEGDLCLCMSPDEMKAQLHEELEIPCGLSAVQTMAPMVRNTFTILSDSSQSEAEGQVLRYGQCFCLGISRGVECKMLYLSSDHRTLLKSSKKSWLQEVTLTDETSHLNRWQAIFLDPEMRLEYEGFPIKANEKLVLYHCHTNRALVVHRHLALRTYFGKEAEVAAHTYLDTRRVEKPRNHWVIVTGNPRDKSSTMLELSKPPADTRSMEPAVGINTQ